MSLLVEFSAPKLLFGNNFDELKDSDFEALVIKLAKTLRNIGIEANSKDISSATVSRIHFGKNIILTDFTTASEIISELSKVNLTTRRHSDTRAYKNEGETLHFFNSSTGIAIYNKKKELQRSKISEKTLIENDNYCQLDLLDKFNNRKPFEVVRIETRYNNRRAIKGILGKVDHDSTDLSFRNLFSAKLAQNILIYEFKRIADSNIRLSEALADGPEEFLRDLNANNPGAKPNQKLIALAIRELIKDTGCREIRNLVQATPTQWARIIKAVDGLEFTKHHEMAFDLVTNELNIFQQVRLEDYGILAEPP